MTIIGEVGDLRRKLDLLERRLETYRRQNVKILDYNLKIHTNQKHYLTKKENRTKLQDKYIKQLVNMKHLRDKLLKFLDLQTLPKPTKEKGRMVLVRLTIAEYRHLVEFLEKDQGRPVTVKDQNLSSSPE